MTWADKTICWSQEPALEAVTGDTLPSPTFPKGNRLFRIRYWQGGPLVTELHIFGFLWPEAEESFE